MRFYKQMEYTFTDVEWHELFARAAQSEGDDFTTVEVSDEEAFFAAPSLEHVGKLRWTTKKHVYHAVCIKSTPWGLEFDVVPEKGNGFNVHNFWEQQKGLIWSHPEVRYVPSNDPEVDIDDCYH
ncbi:MAG: hypothetical protein ACO3YZ_07775 [Candidatus Nanopelagicaceae bacterium]